MQQSEKSKTPQRITDARTLDKAIKLSAMRAERIQKVSAERKRLWTALNEFIGLQGGFVISHPFASPLRVEIPTESSLPVKLREFGYRTHAAGITTRVTSDGIRQMTVIMLDLPKDAPR